MCDQSKGVFQVAHNTYSFHVIPYRAEMGAGCAVSVSSSLEGGQDHPPRVSDWLPVQDPQGLPSHCLARHAQTYSKLSSQVGILNT